MAGMTTTGTTNLSDYNNRSIMIEVTGLCDQDIVRTANCTYKVPYSRMAKTVQRITKMGGKITAITAEVDKIDRKSVV